LKLYFFKIRNFPWVYQLNVLLLFLLQITEDIQGCEIIRAIEG